MAINVEDAFEVNENGFVIRDDDGNIISYLTSGTGDPTGSPAPVNTWYFQEGAPKIWLKYGALDSEWRILGRNEIPDILRLQNAGWTCIVLGEELEVVSGSVAISSKFEKQAGFIRHEGFVKGSA